MNINEIVSRIFAFAALTMSCAMCATVAYMYRDMECNIAHGGASAPASVAFLYAIPFNVVIACCVVISVVSGKKKN